MVQGVRMLRLDIEKFIKMMQWPDPNLVMRVEGKKLPLDAKLVRIHSSRGPYVYVEIFSNNWTTDLVQFEGEGSRLFVDPPVFATHKTDDGDIIVLSRPSITVSGN